MRKTVLLLFVFASLSAAASAEKPAGPDITAQPGQPDPYKIRSELLMEASEHTGVSAPEQAAELWARGLKDRSAAMQYAVMTGALKRDYACQLDELGSNWVTGVSSPWVRSFAITDRSRPDTAHAEIALEFELTSSGGPVKCYNADLWLVKEGPFWRIERIRTDEELYAYTLYKP